MGAPIKGERGEDKGGGLCEKWGGEGVVVVVVVVVGGVVRGVLKCVFVWWWWVGHGRKGKVDILANIPLNQLVMLGVKNKQHSTTNMHTSYATCMHNTSPAYKHNINSSNHTSTIMLPVTLTPHAPG